MDEGEKGTKNGALERINEIEMKTLGRERWMGWHGTDGREDEMG